MTRRWELALLGVSIIWGSTFVVVREAIESTPPMLFLTLRFGVATAVLAAAGAFRGIEREDVRAGAAAGGALFAGCALQTVGLQYTSASNSGFITGLFVVITPLLVAIVLRRLPSAGAAAGVALATGGLVLLAMPAGFGVGRGDALSLGCAGAFALQILLLGRLGHGRPPLRIAGLQVAVTALGSAIWTASAERSAPPVAAEVWLAIAYTGVAATALAYLVQTAAQRVIAPTPAAVIFSAEPAFAGLFGFVFAGDRIGARGGVGAALILGGIFVAARFARERGGAGRRAAPQ